MKKAAFLITLLTFCFIPIFINAQGTWTPLANKTPVMNGGVMVMLLLSDGTVMAKTDSCKSDTFATSTWAKLTPDSHGSYVNGTWTTLAPMHDKRVYFASQVLKDGRVFVAGGEILNEAPNGNSTGGNSGETYNPLTNTWIMAPSQSMYFGDANSEILSDGKVMVATLSSPTKGTLIFNPDSNTWTTGPTCKGVHNESAWVKLKDNSILFVDVASTNSERYIPSINQWIADSNVTCSLYDPFGSEMGAAFLLPDARAFFLGATGHTAYYKPSGNLNKGTWSNGPDFPNGYGTVDAAGAMMVNGKILCAASPVNTSKANQFLSPTAFFEFDYTTNSFKRITAPGGDTAMNIPCYMTQMLDLPDGTVLLSTQNSSQCYVYAPSGVPLSAGKPTIQKISRVNCDTFMITGTLFNGISEGAAYGDDWQMATNYPIVRLTKGTNMFYARTFNWNSTGVQRGNAADTTYFTLPVALPYDSYALAVTANGIGSDTVMYIYNKCHTGINESDKMNLSKVKISPNPASNVLHFSNINSKTVIYLYTIVGDLELKTETEKDLALDINRLPEGIYTIVTEDNNGRVFNKVVITR